MRRAQLSFGDGLIAAEVDDLCEDWMRYADQVLADELLVAAVYEALGKRRPKSRSRGRHGTPAEVVLRLLILKHIRNWSYEVLEREVRANLVYRDFTRVGGAKMPDAKTMGRWGVALAPQVIEQIHDRIVKIARDKGVADGRRMRVDTTVVETNIHYPTDFELVGRWGASADPHHEEDHQDRWQGWCQIARPQPRREAEGAGYCAGSALQGQAEPGETQAGLQPIAKFNQPGSGAGKAVLQGGRHGRETIDRRPATTGAGKPGCQIDAMVPLIRQVMKQTRARILRGDTRADGKILSLFEPATEIIRKGKAGKPNEFGKMVKLQEAENQIVTDYEVV